MRKDTQIGIILGVVILVVIGVFISTRPSVKEPKIPDLTISSERDGSKVKIIDIEDIGVREIDIRELAKAPETEIMDIIEIEEEKGPEEVFVEERQIKKEFGKKEERVKVPANKDDVVIEGKLKGTETKAGEIEEDLSPISSPEEDIEEYSETVTVPKIEEKAPVAEIPKREIIHKVVPSDSLMNLSKQYYGDETKWRTIYEANKDKIQNVNLLQTGLELLIPDIKVTEKKEDVSPYENLQTQRTDDKQPKTPGKHTVKPGDTLFSLARKYYGDPSKWEKIYDANEDNIIDKRLLEVGQILIIPK